MTPLASWSLILALSLGAVLWSLTSIITRRGRERIERKTFRHDGVDVLDSRVPPIDRYRPELDGPRPGSHRRVS